MVRPGLWTNDCFNPIEPPEAMGAKVHYRDAGDPERSIRDEAVVPRSNAAF
jgi:hypothetical protein